jgi:hypothetical protein
MIQLNHRSTLSIKEITTQSTAHWNLWDYIHFHIIVTISSEIKRVFGVDLAHFEEPVT